MVSPLPILYYYSKNGRVPGLAGLIITFFVVAVILNAYDAMANLPILCISGCLGMILSEVLKKNYTIEKTIFLPVIALLIMWSLFLLYQSAVSGVGPWRLIERYIEQIVQENIQFYAKLEVPEEHLNMIRDNSKQITGFFMHIFPALALTSILFTVWINILFGREIFRKNALWYPDFNDLSLWKAPEKLVWLLIAGGGMLLIPMEWVGFGGLNFLIVCLFLYFLQGLAIISFFFSRKHVPKLIRGFVYFLIFAQQYFTILIVATGLFDLWIDFRKYIRPPREAQ